MVFSFQTLIVVHLLSTVLQYEYADYNTPTYSYELRAASTALALGLDFGDGRVRRAHRHLMRAGALTARE